MIYIDLPVGNHYGWGICGANLLKNLSKMTDVCILSESRIGTDDEMDRLFFKSKLIREKELYDLQVGIKSKLNGPVLQSVPYGFPGINTDGLPSKWLKGTSNAGYIFFEETILTPDFIQTLKNHWDTIITGAKWCEETLKEYGYENTKTIIQGVDPGLFNPINSEKEYFQDKFIIFSGGKFEYRKAQDIVIKAYKILQDKYKDVMLVNSWYTNVMFGITTMNMSKHINFAIKSENQIEMYNHILADNGIDLSRVVTLKAYPNNKMARIYKNTDIGLFPNRCEGGTNLVLMEYMACGKPAIASYNFGHKDILTPENSLRAEKMYPVNMTWDNRDVAEWEEPDIDEIVSHLEWAYHNRDKIKEIGKKGAEDMSRLTWTNTAEEFYKALVPYPINYAGH